MSKVNNDHLPSLDSFEVDSEILSGSPKGLDSENADEAFLRWEKDEHKAFHWVKMGCIFVVPILAGVTIVCYFANILLPASCRWLTVEELSGIQSLVVSIISGVTTSLAVNYFYKNGKN